MQSPLQAKRISIRRARRREQLEQLFANKRKILLQTHADFQKRSVYLLDLYHQLERGVSVQLNIQKMMNCLAEVEPFLLYSKQGRPQQHEIDKFCLDLTDLVLGKIICRYKNTSKVSYSIRINCIGIMINLVAEESCPNDLLAVKLASFLKNNYEDVQNHGVDKQVLQIGWLLGNLIGNSKIVRASDTVLQYLLGWIQELCQIKNQDMLRVMYLGLSKLLAALHNYYCLQKYQLPQVFKSSFLNIIAFTVQRNLTDQSPNTLISVLVFINSSIAIVRVSCEYLLLQTIVKRSIPLMGSIYKRVIREVCRLCISCLRYNWQTQQVSLGRQIVERVQSRVQKIRLLMVDEYSQKLLNLLCVKEMDMKVELLSVILELVSGDSHCSYVVDVFLKGRLEDVLIKIGESGHEEVIIGCSQVIYEVLKNTGGEQGRRFVEAMQRLKLKNLSESIQVLRDFYSSPSVNCDIVRI